MKTRTFCSRLFAILGAAPLAFAQAPVTTPTVEAQQRALAQLNAGKAAAPNPSTNSSGDGQKKQIAIDLDSYLVRTEQKTQASDARLAAPRNQPSQHETPDGTADGSDSYEAIANQLKAISRRGIEIASRSSLSARPETGGAASPSTAATNAPSLDLARNINQELLGNTSGGRDTPAPAPGIGAQALGIANSVLTDQHRAKMEQWVRKNETKIRRYVNDSNPELRNAASQTLKTFGLFKDEPFFPAAQPPPVSSPAVVPPAPAPALASAIAQSAPNPDPATTSAAAASAGGSAK